MRYPVIAAALLLLPAVLITDAVAAGPRQGVQIINNNYIMNDNDNDRYGPSYRRGRNYEYEDRGYRDYGYRYHHFNTHEEAVARIQATHSPYRQTYHPRSYYNSPPAYYRW